MSQVEPVEDVPMNDFYFRESTPGLIPAGKLQNAPAPRTEAQARADRDDLKAQLRRQLKPHQRDLVKP